MVPKCKCQEDIWDALVLSLETETFIIFQSEVGSEIWLLKISTGRFNIYKEISFAISETILILLEFMESLIYRVFL